MAQTRNFKIGTVYSRLRSLLEKKAMNEEAKPVWYDIYEAFPPKYEPRFDRHLISYGAGSNVSKLAPPPKILYKEDKIRAQYYTAFMPNNGKQHMPCPFTGPKMFWAGPNFLCQTKNLFTYCGSHKHFVPDKKMICIQ